MNADIQDQEFLKSLKILYVEDEEDTREQFGKFLTRISKVLITAEDGSEGLEAYREQSPDIIITDIHTPNMDGLDMVREIRKLDKSVPIIIMTAFEQIDYLKRSINMGVDKYVTKPVNGSELYETVLDCARRLLAEKKLLSAAGTDPLTGLINRRELMNRFMSEKGRAERHGTPFCVIIADIDHFKNVNDTFGHIAGDRILSGVADTLTSSVRTEDILGRFGGEEFLLILPETDLDAATVVAEKIRSAVSDLETEWEGKTISVTISMGVVKFKPGMGMDECIQPADHALYRAKTGGRNRFVVAGD
ncbi:MAG: diguanylate cyclase [Desulfuromonadaceae bacterium]|nr:diguanylate cyclase [Desulfuromonadaceae bacterium]